MGSSRGARDYIFPNPMWILHGATLAVVSDDHVEVLDAFIMT